MITEDYVSFEVARLLKDKGFNEACNRVYEGPNLKYTTIPISPLMSLGEFGGFHPKQLYVNNNELGDIVYTAPTQQMSMKWLREVHNINIDIVPIWNQKRFEYQVFVVTPENAKHCYIDDKLYLGYEQACEAALKYCLENLI